MIMETKKKTTGGWLGRGCNAMEVEVEVEGVNEG